MIAAQLTWGCARTDDCGAPSSTDENRGS